MKNRIILLVFAIVTTISFYGQQNQESLPIDSNVRYGKLDNGLTYYIRHNKYPEKRADFYIAQKVGSMQEEDNQSGLAHFLEHMAFNGTTHFPGRKTMLNYLESIGAQFGSNINAYTSFDETVYTLTNIPVTRPGIVDSTLLILHDWSGYIELDNKEIDKERLIIKEEWRTRNGAQQRFWEEQLPVIFKGSKYANRLPIGKMEIIDNFKYQLIKDYYKKWYRPDLQAIIIVGDINPHDIEQQIIKLFSPIPLVKNAAKRVYYPVPNNKETVFSILTDPEESKSNIYYYIKHDPIPASVKWTQAGYAKATTINLAASMLTERLATISKRAESPFLVAYVYDSDFFVSKTKSAWTTMISSKEGLEKESLDVILTENERVKQFGFTQTELDRAKQNLLKLYENAYNNREKQQNNSYVSEYVRAFIDGEAIPGIEYEYNMVRQILPSIDLNVIASTLSNILTESNNVVTLTGPQKQGFTLPQENDLKEVFIKIKSKTLEAYTEEEVPNDLISSLPVAGKIVKEEQDKVLGITTWTLSNGIKVTFKQTNFKDDEILMASNSYGGRSLVKDNEIAESTFIGFIPSWGGIGLFNSTDLKKVLSGKNVDLNISVGNSTHGVIGHASINDLETLLQLNYLYLTAPREDSEAFYNFQNMVVSRMKNLEKDPSFSFQQQVTYSKYANSPRMRDLTVSDIESLDYKKIIELYNRLFSNSLSTVYNFVGNINPELLKPLVETYLASLPSRNQEITLKDDGIRVKEGMYELEYTQKMVVPKSKVYITYTGNIDYSLQNQIWINVLKQLLDIVYVRTIREAEGGTYGVGVDAIIKRFPKNEASLAMMFDTNPENVKKLTEIIHRELKNIVSNGPDNNDFMKVKEYMLKQLEEDINTNSYWLSIVSDKTFYSEDNFSSYRNIIESLSAKDIQNIASKLVDQNNIIEVIMNPTVK